MSWKCRHCGHEATSEESCCWEHWDEACSKARERAMEFTWAALGLAIVVVLVLLAKFAHGGIH